MEKIVNVIGAGLAGVEACHQLVKRGYKVRLYEMRPKKMTPAHHSGNFAELVCSNSLRADGTGNAVGVLKAEMEMMDSLIIKYARKHQVPAGGALAVDRNNFSQAITEYIQSHPLIEVIHEEAKEFPAGYTIIASGPLTSDALATAIKEKLGEDYFYFYDALVNAEVVKPKDFEEKFFEGCMPFEEMARRGKQTLLFGPMKPVGLTAPDGTRPYAVVQLRQDNVQASLYNIVGFQTHLTWPEQKRIIQMIPGLENASFVRYGVMHRNSFICSPKHLLKTYQLKNYSNIFMAGQITGVEGYVESAQSGMAAGINMVRLLEDKEPLIFPENTVMGALANYITNASKEDFQPMKANFGILPDFPIRIKKKERKAAYASRALETMKGFVDENNLG